MNNGGQLPSNSDLKIRDHKEWFYTAQHLIDFVEFLEDHVENLKELSDLFEKKCKENEKQP